MSHPVFTPQPQSITALWTVLTSQPTEGRRLSWGCPFAMSVYSRIINGVMLLYRRVLVPIPWAIEPHSLLRVAVATLDQRLPSQTGSTATIPCPVPITHCRLTFRRLCRFCGILKMTILTSVTVVILVVIYTTRRHYTSNLTMKVALRNISRSCSCIYSA